MKKFTLKSITPKEKDVQGAIIDYLLQQQALGRVLFFKRNNGGGMERQHKGTKRWTWFYFLYLPNEKPKSRDYPDIDGMLTDGTPFYIECKRPASPGKAGGIVRAGQKEFIELVVLRGAVAGIVDSVDDVVSLIQERML